MTRNTLLVTLSLLLMTALSAPLLSNLASKPADGVDAAVVQEPAQEGEHEQTLLAKGMEDIKKGMRQLRRGLRKQEQLPAALPVILAMQEAAQFCKTEKPAMTGNVEGGDEAQAEFVKQYRLGMIELQSGLLMLEQAVLNGDMELAQKIYQKLKDAQESGHEKFTEE